MKIITCLLNPTIDQIYHIENFQVGGTFKVTESFTYPVGKAISFSLGCLELCRNKDYLKLIAFIGESDISLYSQFLSLKNINYEFIEIKGKTRSNKTINDPIRGTTTHIREKGFKVSEENIQTLRNLLKANITKGDFVVFSGSIPSNVDDNIYCNLINIAKNKGALTILDTNAGALIEGIKADPEIIKPNLLELSQILNEPEINHLQFSNLIETCKILADKAQKLLNKELKIILITLGEKGAVLVKNDILLYGNVKVEEVIDTVGSGDSFLAGFILNYFEKKDIYDCFKNAIACGAANTLIPGPGIFRLEDVKKIREKVNIFELIK